MVRTQSVCLDTHAIVWIVAGQAEKLGAEARALIDTAPLLISPAVRLELQFLYEVGRVTAPAEDAIRTLQHALDVRIATEPFDHVVSAAVGESWTRDPFDRLIVAHARLMGALLVTRDRRMQAAYRETRW